MPGSQRSRLLEAARRLTIDVAAAEAADYLRRAGVESILLRGPGLAGRLYERAEERDYSDVDLLVEPDRFDAAEAAMRELGYEEAALEVALPDARPAHAHTWSRHGGATVDLHRTLVGVGCDPARLWGALRPFAVGRALGLTEVLTPSTGALAFVVALHAAHHAARSDQPLRDLELALERLDRAAWEEAAALAQALDAVPAFAAGLSQLEAGRSLSLGLGLGDEGTPQRTLAGGRAFHVAQGLVWLRDVPGTQAKAAFLRERLLPAPATMRIRSPLARRGRLGLVAAHVLRWGDAVRNLPRALAALRRAR